MQSCIQPPRSASVTTQRCYLRRPVSWDELRWVSFEHGLRAYIYNPVLNPIVFQRNQAQRPGFYLGPKCRLFSPEGAPTGISALFVEKWNKGAYRRRSRPLEQAGTTYCGDTGGGGRVASFYHSLGGGFMPPWLRLAALARCAAHAAQKVWG